MLPMTVLLVDGNEGSRCGLSALLRRDGHEVIATGSWDTARRLACEGPFDLLISELSLPDRVERDLMGELGRRYGTRGILLTAFEEQLAGGWRRAGFSHFLYKPVGFEQVRAAMRQLAAQPRACPPISAQRDRGYGRLTGSAAAW